MLKYEFLVIYVNEETWRLVVFECDENQRLVHDIYEGSFRSMMKELNRHATLKMNVPETELEFRKLRRKA